MKKVNTISNVLGIIPFRTFLFVFTTNNKSELNEEIFFISVDNFYFSKSSDKCVIYQLTKSGTVFMVSEYLETTKFTGEYSILGAFEFQNGFAVANRNSKSYHYLDSKKATITDLGFYFKKSGDFNGKYLFKRLGDEVTLFSLASKEVIRTFNIPRDLCIDARLEDNIIYKENIIYIPLSNGQLLALNISTGELRWKQDRVGRIALFQDMIYGIADYTIKELDSTTGEILRQESMQDLIDTYGFRSTGAHKVFDEYIFAMASGKPGMVAIYDRRALKFQEMIKLDEMIPVGTDHLHWHKGKLYILDFGKTLNIFENQTTE